jgi:DNA-binding HxlR family transcriptional regulator
VWFLRGSPRRFSELKGDLPGISAKVLASRLKTLEESGVVLRRRVATVPPTVEYSLTPIGADLGAALVSVVEIGERLKQSVKIIT